MMPGEALALAYHEAGHALHNARAGATAQAVERDHEGGGWRVDALGLPVPTAEEVPEVFAGILAGPIAELIARGMSPGEVLHVVESEGVAGIEARTKFSGDDALLLRPAPAAMLVALASALLEWMPAALARPGFWTMDDFAGRLLAMQPGTTIAVPAAILAAARQ